MHEKYNSSGDKTFPTEGEHMVHIVQSWDKSNLDPKKPTVRIHPNLPHN